MRAQTRSRHLAAALLLSACGSESEDQPQLVVFVDTDAACVGQLSADRSPAAAIDVVRIEGLAANGQVFDAVQVVITDPSDFPISFGIAATAPSTRLRIRAFSTATTLRTEKNGVVEYEPSPRLAIERVVDLGLPESGKQGALVMLSAECFGRPSSFEPEGTCLDGGPDAAFDAGVIAVDADSPPSTQVGTSPRVALTPCTSVGPDEVCISGGLSVLGSDDLAGVLVDTTSLDATPARLVWLSPFGMERREISVGRFRELVNAPAGFDAPLPRLSDPNTIDRDCTWLGPDDASHDELPLNCVEVPTAERVCELLGGRLPTEAEWERAARGPGSSNSYPWGDLAPECCTASFGRGGTASCETGGVEPVGSHAPSDACKLGDRTTEGVEDLGGGMSEVMRDGPVAYDAPCWSEPGIAENPSCNEDDPDERVIRGGSWGEEGIRTLSALRTTASDGLDQIGVRCVYPE